MKLPLDGLKNEASEALEVGLCGIELGEETLLGLKLARVDATTAGFDADRVLEVEHLVVEEVFDGTSGRVGTVEDTGNDNGVMCGVVVAEHAAGVVGTPGERGATQQAVEKTGIERLEDFV